MNSRTKILLVVSYLSCLVNPLLSQQKQKVLLTDLILAAIEAEQDTVYSNLDISMDNINAKDNNYQVILNQDTIESESDYLPLGDWLKVFHGDKIEIIDGKVAIPNKIEFEYCDFSDGLQFIDLHFENDLLFYECEMGSDFFAQSSRFQRIGLSFSRFSDWIVFYDNHFQGDFYFAENTITGTLSFYENQVASKVSILSFSSINTLYISDNTFLDHPAMDSLIAVKNDSMFYGRSWKIWPRLDVQITNPSVTFNFDNNRAESLNNGDFYFIHADFDNVYVNNNKLHGALNLGGSAQKLYLEDNEITYVSFEDFSFSEQNNKLDWEDFENSQLVAFNYPDVVNENQDGFDIIDFQDLGIPDSASMKRYAEQSDGLITYYLGENDLEMADRENYKDLLRSYYRLHAAFNAEGDIESANASYVKMKDLETRRLRYLYFDEGGFDRLFRWQLNALLSAYTDYGTNPAKAVRISFYIIFIFGVFYFFFPSEWDKESKKNLLLDFRKFFQKNDHGYVKPFFKLSQGVLLSLINGMMLSLNAFVTLGFGKIPTTGFPRYVCIIQGFIGWFLLSIFTVALINQVLF